MPTTFADLGVPKQIVRALEIRGITEPFEIQATTIADLIDGRDVCGRAPTGSGKTLAFGIPLVADATKARPRKPTSLVLSPTRELADQIAKELGTFAGDVRIGVVYGGVSQFKQVKQLNKGVDILVACPGRLEDLIGQGALSLERVNKVVIDEADRMADMGFMPAVRRVLDQTGEQRQTVLFSATLDGEVAKLTRDYQDDPITHLVGEATPDITLAEHRFLAVSAEQRVEATAQAISESGQAIVFCRTRHGSDRLVKQLKHLGVSAVPIHGGHAQNRRTRALADFTKGRVQALVATDVAARGIHVDNVDSVIHFDPPENATAYIHRSGRTARAGRSGLVVSLVMPDQKRETSRMQRQLGLEQTFSADEIKGGSTKRPRRSRPRHHNDSPAGANRSRSSGTRAASSDESRRPTSPGAKPQGRRPAGTKPGAPKAKHTGAKHHQKHGASSHKPASPSSRRKSRPSQKIASAKRRG